MSKAKARVFVPLTKVDEEQRLVYGRITQEVMDKAKEVMDYETSKPFFEKWSNGIHEASGGLSKGNVRVMHGLVAAGKLTELDFDDADQAIDVCAKVVDDGEWEKVKEGVYTGFSVGGSYEKKWTETDPETKEKIKKYTANPNEVSLVDNPCVPSATFTMFKADGAEEQVQFKVENDDEEWPGFSKAAGAEPKKTDDEEVEADEAATEEEGEEEGGTDDPDQTKEKKEANKVADYTPTNEEVVEKATELAKAANDGTTWMNHIETAHADLIKAKTPKPNAEGADPASKGQAKKPSVEGGETTDHGDAEVLGGKGTDKEGKKTKKDGKASAPKAADGSTPANKVTPTGVKQQWTASDGKAFEKKADAEAHEEKLQKGETEAEKLRRMLKAVTEGVDAAEQPVVEEADLLLDGDLDRLHKAFVELDQPRDAEGAPKLEKGMYTVSRFADVISTISGLVKTIKAEGVLEADDDDEGVAATLKASLSSFTAAFMAYAKDQVAEVLKGMDEDLSPRCCYDYYYRAAQDDTENALAKDVSSLIESVKEDLGEDYDPTEEQQLAKRAPVETEDSTPLQKRFDALQGDYDDLRKVAGEAIEQLGGLAKRVKELEDTPLPRAPRNVAHKEGDTFLGKTVTTESDKMSVLKEMLDTHGADGLATLMIKAAHSTGGQQLHLKQQ